jgi:hypothetical protein
VPAATDDKTKDKASAPSGASATSRSSSRSRSKPAAKKSSGSSSSGSKTAKVSENPAAERSAPGWVDNHSIQNLKTGALQGHFVKVTGGEHAGRYGVYLDNGEMDDKTGQPKTIIVDARDDRQGERLIVGYDDCERAQAGLR